MQNNTFSGLFVGQNLIRLNEVDSTNTFLKNALSKSTPFLEGTVILAEKQFAGRGQSGNSWQSEEGKNLTFSILLNPVFLQVEKQFELNKAISLALNDVLSKYFDRNAFIKWPNDLYINNKKIGGMLIENIVQGNRIKHAIVGIGLNVNQNQFPDNLKNITSFNQELHQDYDLMGILNEICSSVEARYLQLRSGALEKLDHDYLNKLYLMRQWSVFRFDGRIESGKILGVSDLGQLLLETTEGLREFNNKEIEFINP